MKKIHYSWLICLVGTLSLFCCMGLVSSIMPMTLTYVRLATGFSNTQTSVLLTIRFLFSGITMLFLDKLLKRFGAKHCMQFALVLLICGHLCFAAGSSYGVYALGSALNGVVYAMGGLVVISFLISQWFHSRQHFALSICSAGSGMATIIIPPIWTWFRENHGLSTAFFAECVLCILVFIFITLTAKNAPSDIGLEPFISEKAEKVRKKEFDSPPTSIIMAILLVCMFFCGFFGNMAVAQIANVYTEKGLDAYTVSYLVSMMGIMLVIGKLTFGASSDRFGKKKTNLIFSFILLVSYCLYALNVRNVPLAFFTMVLVGFGLPTGTIGVNSIAMSFSDEGSFIKTLERFQVVNMAGGMLSGIAPGLVADLTGSYLPIIAFAAVLNAIYWVLIFIAYQRQHS